jgi:nitroreductase
MPAAQFLRQTARLPGIGLGMPVVSRRRMDDRPHFLLNRRQLMELGGVAAAGALLASCSSVIRGDVAAEPAGAASALPEPIGAILHDAALAPSSHNSQPWRVVVEPARLVIYADLQRALHDVDPAGRELRLSLGAFVENLVTSAAARGLACRVDVTGEADLEQPVAEIGLARAPRSAYPLERLRQRCTVRHGLGSAALPRDAIARLVAADPSAVRFIDGRSPAAAAIREATVAAFRQQTGRDSAQRELSRWTRFGNDAVRTHRDGLTTASMGITGLSSWYVRAFYDEDDVMAAGFRRRSIEMTAEQVREAGGWLVVTSRDDQPGSILEAGRVYERLALIARECGVGLHPMSQALEEAPYRAQLLGALALDGVAQLVVRAGRVDDYPEPATLRRSVASFAAANASVRATAAGRGSSGSRRAEPR